MARTTFDVWAPKPTNVQLLLDGQTCALTRDEDGWWRSSEQWRPGADYGYLLDGSDPRPDPQSLRQPDGVHGLSRSFDPSAYAWTDSAWAGRSLSRGVIYELHLGTFTPEGTLDAAAGRLDYLVELGIDFVELLPVNAFNGTWNWGYDGVLWSAVQEQYGGPEAYQRFVDAAHAAGLAVIQDVVYNHLGPSGNYLPEFGPYLHSAASNTWGDSINLDGEGSGPVRRLILDNALGWLRDFHVDGLRLDAVHALHDESPVHLLAELSGEVDKLSAELGRPLTLIAESDLNDAKMVYPVADGGNGMDGQWSDDFHHALHVNLTGETVGYYEDFAGLKSLVKVLRDGFYHDGSYSSFRGADHGAPIRPGTPAAALVVCAQNHDQIGNRAAGDRLTATLSGDQLRLAAAVNLLSPFTPMLFMGEEYGATTPWQFFTSHPEPDLGKATAEGRFAEFEKMGWDKDSVPDPQDPQTFRNSKLDWTEATSAGGTELLDLYRSLIAFRRDHPQLAESNVGDANVEAVDGWVSWELSGLRVLANFAADPAQVPVSGGAVLLSTAEDGVHVADGTLSLPGYCAVVLG